jgi:ketosteroid isomerase-like protein
MIDATAGGRRVWHCPGGFDGDGWVALFTDDAEYHEDPFGEPIVGHNALRAYLLEAATSQRDVEFTVERHWASGATVLAVRHATFTGGQRRVHRLAGFLTAEVAQDRPGEPLREWWHARRRAGGRGQEERWPETSHSTS